MGVHPYRQWCHQTAHRDTGKCPIHVAAEKSQLLILKLFITKNFLTLACRDPAGHDPLKVALQHGHRDCVQYLANKLSSVVSLPNMSLPMRIYLQIKCWVSLGQRKAASNRCQVTSAARACDTLLVDGFNQPNMSSKVRRAVPGPSRGIKVKALRSFSPISNLLSASHLPSKVTKLQLPSLQSVNNGDFKEIQKEQKQYVMKSREDGLLDKISKEDSGLCKGKFKLPPITSSKSISMLMFVGASSKSSHILESSSHYCGQTPRENAAHYLTIARSLSFALFLVCSCARKTHLHGCHIYI